MSTPIATMPRASTPASSFDWGFLLYRLRSSPLTVVGLVMIVTVNHDGRVLATEIVQGSGNPRLDRQAEAIAMASGPFGPFGAEMRKKADQIAVVSRFKFTRDQTLETTVR